jgi:hypothetical protein
MSENELILLKEESNNTKMYRYWKMHKNLIIEMDAVRKVLIHDEDI